MVRINRTRFEGLAYINVDKGLWRVIDVHTSRPVDMGDCRCVGPQYRSKSELLADLERYAVESWGYSPVEWKPKTETAKAFAGLNACEQLQRVQGWLDWQTAKLSNGLRTPEDALKLYRGWINDPELPELADAENDTSGAVALVRARILGYDPLA